MNNSNRVGRAEGACDLPADIEDRGNRHMPRHQRPQGHAAVELLDDLMTAVGRLADVLTDHEVRRIQRVRGERLSQELMDGQPGLPIRFGHYSSAYRSLQLRIERASDLPYVLMA